MGLIGTIAGVVEGVAGAVSTVAGLFTDLDGHSGYGASLDGHSGYGSAGIPYVPGSTMVGMPNPNVMTLGDPKVSEVDVQKSDLTTPAMIGMNKDAILMAGTFQSLVETDVMAMPMMNMKKTTQDISFSKSYAFTNSETDLGADTIKINFNDHAYFHLIPRRFDWYNKILEHEYVKLHYIDITVTQDTDKKNATIIGFLPVTKDTRQISNKTLLLMTHQNTYQEGQSFTYRLMYVSPNEMTYQMDKNGDYTSIKPVNPWINPNYVMRTDYLRGMPHNKITGSDTLVEGGNEMSYGTMILMKRNPGTEDIGVTIKIVMHFECWDALRIGQSINKTLIDDGIVGGDGIEDGSEGEGEDGDSGDGDSEDGDGQTPGGDGAMPPQGATRRPVASGRRARKN